MLKKVKMLIDAKGTDGSPRVKGATYDLEEPEANRWLTRKQAELAEDEPKKAVTELAGSAVAPAVATTLPRR